MVRKDLLKGPLMLDMQAKTGHLLAASSDMKALVTMTRNLVIGMASRARELSKMMTSELITGTSMWSSRRQ